MLEPTLIQQLIKDSTVLHAFPIVETGDKRSFYRLPSGEIAEPYHIEGVEHLSATNVENAILTVLEKARNRMLFRMAHKIDDDWLNKKITSFKALSTFEKPIIVSHISKKKEFSNQRGFTIRDGHGYLDGKPIWMNNIINDTRIYDVSRSVIVNPKISIESNYEEKTDTYKVRADFTALIHLHI